MSMESDKKRFMAKVKFVGDCWIWTASKLPAGYGRFFYDGKVGYAHRASLAMFRGEDFYSPLETLHSCDTPECVNPDHLSFGTHSANMIDALEKGRAKGVFVAGEEHPARKVSSHDIEKMVLRVKSGEASAAIAKDFGLHHSTVSEYARKAGVYCPVSPAQRHAEVRAKALTCKRGHPWAEHSIPANRGGRRCGECKRLGRSVRAKQVTDTDE